MITAGPTRRIGVVDLGSNTARLVVFECEPGRWFRLIDSIRERIRLAEGLQENGELRPEAIDRALAALELFADYAKAAQLDEVELIATSAVRDANNRDEILERIRQLGFEPQVLEGPLEASYGVLAVANGLSVSDAWVLDQGGGSLQISEMRGREFQRGEAHPLGAVVLSERFLGLGKRKGRRPPKTTQVEELEATLEERLQPVMEQIAADDLPLVAMGGTVRNLARMTQRRRRYPLPLLHAYEMPCADLEAVTTEILDRSVGERARLSGLNADRADIIAAGAIVYRWLARRSGRDHILISGHGVREGAFYRRFLDSPWLIEDIRTFSVANLFERFRQPRLHTEKVRQLAGDLFDELASLHGLDPSEKELLDAAALLHDIGMTLGYYRHHRHGSFLIEALGLSGFSHREMALISKLVQYHRKGIPKPGQFSSLMADGDQRRLEVLALCLRLAEHLERSRTGRVRRLAIERHESHVELVLFGAHRATVEMWEASKDAPLFKRVIGAPLEIRFEVEPAPDPTGSGEPAVFETTPTSTPDP